MEKWVANIGNVLAVLKMGHSFGSFCFYEEGDIT